MDWAYCSDFRPWCGDGAAADGSVASGVRPTFFCDVIWILAVLTVVLVVLAVIVGTMLMTVEIGRASCRERV